jgi:hypothetical protein
LIVNAYAVLTLAVANQRFKTIAGQSDKVSERRGRFQTLNNKNYALRHVSDPMSAADIAFWLGLRVERRFSSVQRSSQPPRESYWRSYCLFL